MLDSVYQSEELLFFMHIILITDVLLYRTTAILLLYLSSLYMRQKTRLADPKLTSYMLLQIVTSSTAE